MLFLQKEFDELRSCPCITIMTVGNSDKFKSDSRATLIQKLLLKVVPQVCFLIKYYQVFNWFQYYINLGNADKFGGDVHVCF